MRPAPRTSTYCVSSRRISASRSGPKRSGMWSGRPYSCNWAVRRSVSTSRRRPPTAACTAFDAGGVAPADQHAAVVRRDLDLGAAIQAEAVAQRLGDGDAALAGDAHGVSPPADGGGARSIPPPAPPPAPRAARTRTRAAPRSSRAGFSALLSSLSLAGEVTSAGASMKSKSGSSGIVPAESKLSAGRGDVSPAVRPGLLRGPRGCRFCDFNDVTAR